MKKFFSIKKIGLFLISVFATMFIFIFVVPYYSFDHDFQSDLKASLASGNPLPEKWETYLKSADIICFLPFYATEQSISIDLSDEARSFLGKKLAFPSGYAENIWWIIGVSDREIIYMLKMNSSISPDSKFNLCGDSHRLVLQTIPGQPALFNVQFN